MKPGKRIRGKSPNSVRQGEKCEGYRNKPAVRPVLSGRNQYGNYCDGAFKQDDENRDKLDNIHGSG